MGCYALFTLWLTLSVIFFLCNFLLKFLDVVTLGGLVAGSFMLGTWSILLQLILQKIEDTLTDYGKAIHARDPHAPGFSTTSRYVCKFLFLYVFNLLGVYVLVKILPGYEITKLNILGPILCVYSVLHLEARRILEGLEHEN